MSHEYEVAWSATSRRQPAGLPEKAATAVVEFVYGALADNPHRVGRVLRFELHGHHSARRGDYRVIYVIDEGVRRVTIRVIEHRSDVYRRRQD